MKILNVQIEERKQLEDQGFKLFLSLREAHRIIKLGLFSLHTYFPSRGKK